ncbi:MAG: RES family NAD+ phosphorylase [Silvibacterium sp.]|jgi:RES domain-containing protein
MVLWRISRHRDLSGVGGLKAAGRWHYAGHVIVYLTETPASSLLEVCVHTSANDIPPEFALLKIEGPNVEVPSIKIDDLPEDWRTQLEVTRDLGAAWLEKNESVLLAVPSAIVPETVNFLLNPSHKQAPKFRIADVFSYPFDPRLKT